MREIIIGICDDEMLAVLQIEKMVIDYLERVEREVKILLFQSGRELLEHIEELHILFLDIEMPKMDGIEIGKNICKRNKECKIIMATGHLERFKEAFKIDAFRFVTKPFDSGEVEDALQDAFDTLIRMDNIEFYKNRTLCKIQQKDIKYIKSYSSFIEANVGNQILRKEISLSKLEELLDRNIFYRINREILVNMFRIDSYKNGIINVGSQTFKVARRRKKDFERAFIEFDLKYRG